MRPLRCRPGSGRPTAAACCGPMRSAPSFLARPTRAALAEKTFGPADTHRRQVIRLARQLPASGAIRLERLRGFGARLGTLMTCGCARLDFADGSSGVLVTAMDPGLRTMSLVERLHRLVDGAAVPMAAFAPDGMFAGASEAARALLGFRDLGEAGLEQARSDALATGRVELPIGIGKMVLQRVGVGADVGLVALIEPAVAKPTPVAENAPDPAPEVTTAPAPQAPVEPAPQAARDAAGERACRWNRLCSTPLPIWTKRRRRPRRSRPNRSPRSGDRGRPDPGRRERGDRGACRGNDRGRHARNTG